MLGWCWLLWEEACAGLQPRALKARAGMGLDSLQPTCWFCASSRDLVPPSTLRAGTKGSRLDYRTRRGHRALDLPPCWESSCQALLHASPRANHVTYITPSTPPNNPESAVRLVPLQMRNLRGKGLPESLPQCGRANT